MSRPTAFHSVPHGDLVTQHSLPVPPPAACPLVSEVPQCLLMDQPLFVLQSLRPQKNLEMTYSSLEQTALDAVAEGVPHGKATLGAMAPARPGAEARCLPHTSGSGCSRCSVI